MIFCILFRKYKSLRPSNFYIEFYLGSHDIIEKDLQGVTEESRVQGILSRPLNTTSVALIPKKDEPNTFDDFNSVYKMI